VGYVGGDLKLASEPHMNLSSLILEHEWSVYRDVIEAASWQNLRFCLGGGLAFSAYSERKRGTKDIDLFILKEDRAAFVELLSNIGYVDYHDREPYDQSWIYRGYLEKVVLDLIWCLPNHRVCVEPDWFERGAQASIHGQTVHLIPPEDVIRSKVYVLQRDACHWSDLLNLLEFHGDKLDWHYLLSKDISDMRLLGGLLNVFAWISPAKAQLFPEFVWGHVGLLPPTEKSTKEDRAFLLDSRDWFGPGQNEANELKKH